MSEKSDGTRKVRGKPQPDGRVAPGRGPAKGAPNAGRPPNWWREKMAELRDRWLVAAEAHGIVDDPNHPEWYRLGKSFHEAVDGRPSQAIEHSGTLSIADALAAARERAKRR